MGHTANKKTWLMKVNKPPNIDLPRLSNGNKVSSMKGCNHCEPSKWNVYLFASFRKHLDFMIYGHSNFYQTRNIHLGTKIELEDKDTLMTICNAINLG